MCRTREASLLPSLQTFPLGETQLATLVQGGKLSLSSPCQLPGCQGQHIQGCQGQHNLSVYLSTASGKCRVEVEDPQRPAEEERQAEVEEQAGVEGQVGEGHAHIGHYKHWYLVWGDELVSLGLCTLPSLASQLKKCNQATLCALTDVWS